MNKYIHFNQMLDQLLVEMEIADIRNMVLVLAGALDGAISFGCDPACLRRTLLAHPIGAFFTPGSHHFNALEHISSTRKRLSGAVEQLGFARALRVRARLTCDAVVLALKNGGHICLLDEAGETEIEQMDTSGAVKVTHAYKRKCGKLCIDTSLDMLDLSQAAGVRFDQILATRIADNLSGAALRSIIMQAGQSLTESGSLLLSCFVPEHIGRGWRTVCQGEQVHCHDEASLAQIADECGLRISQFRDASGCLIWAELKRCENQSSKWG